MTIANSAEEALKAGLDSATADETGAWRIVAEESKVAIFAPDGSSVAVSGMDFAVPGYGDSLICRLLWALDTPAHSIYCQKPAGPSIQEEPRHD